VAGETEERGRGEGKTKKPARRINSHEEMFPRGQKKKAYSPPPDMKKIGIGGENFDNAAYLYGRTGGGGRGPNKPITSGQ